MKTISVEEFEFVRRRLRNLMPSNMKSFEVEWIKSARPDAEYLSKEIYIKGWLNVFDIDCNDSDVKQLMNYSVHNLKKSFDWVMDNFSELDLGGNSKWCGALHSVLKYLKRSAWNVDSERKLMYRYLIKTRWAYEDGV